MLENEEIGGTTFTEMVEDIIIDSGLDMTLTMGFVETEMNIEEQILCRRNFICGHIRTNNR